MLQLAVTKLIAQFPDAPPVDIEIDGVIGPTLTLGVQAIAHRLSSGGHHDLAGAIPSQPEEGIPAVAERAMEIAGYLEHVLKADPTAVVAPKVLGEPIDPLAQLKALFTGKRIAAIAGTLLGIAAFVGLGAVVQRRTLGTIDRSNMLPPSDGTDEFEEDEDDGHGAHDMSDVDTGSAIDAQAVEVTSHAA